MKHTEQYWIEHLELAPHPEGGYFKEVYRSDEQLKEECLPARYDFDHHLSTSIYFLLPQNHYSIFHRLRGDEIWHFYAGAPVTLYIINPSGKLVKKYLGRDLASGHQPQALVPRQHWFAAVAEHGGYALVGCVMTPGFEFDDLELADKEKLIQQYPQHEDLIRKFAS